MNDRTQYIGRGYDLYRTYCDLDGTVWADVSNGRVDPSELREGDIIVAGVWTSRIRSEDGRELLRVTGKHSVSIDVQSMVAEHDSFIEAEFI